jgi:hypothetical protein
MSSVGGNSKAGGKVVSNFGHEPPETCLYNRTITFNGKRHNLVLNLWTTGVNRGNFLKRYKRSRDRCEEPMESKVQRVLRFFKHNSVIALMSVLVGIVIGTGELAKAFHDIVAVFHPEPTPLVLARDNAKSEFSRRLTQDAWDRLFWIRSYLGRVERHATLSDLEYAWNKYIDASEQWNKDLMMNYQALEEYYPNSGKGAAFLWDIQPRFIELNTRLADLHYKDSPHVESKEELMGVLKADPHDQELSNMDREQLLLKVLNRDVDQLNPVLFYFVTTKSEKELKNQTK